MVLLSPFGFSPTGEAFNLTMEDVATSIGDRAAGRQAALRDRGARHPRKTAGPTPKTTRSTPSCRWPTPSSCSPALPTPQQPTDTAFYLQHCVQGLPAAASSASHILPFAIDGALLMEVLRTTASARWWSTRSSRACARRRADDIGGILQLIEPFERDGTLVKRDRTEIERDIANYTVIEHDGVIFGCAALYPYPEAQDRRDGGADGVAAESRARATASGSSSASSSAPARMGLESIFVLTTRTMHWFIKRGFVQVDPDWLPEARKRKYNWDRRSQVFVKKLGLSRIGVQPARRRSPGDSTWHAPCNACI